MPTVCRRHGHSAVDHMRAYIRNPCDCDASVCGSDCRRSHAPYRRVIFPIRNHRPCFPDGKFLSGTIHREAGRAGYRASPGARFARGLSALSANRHGGQHCRCISDSHVSTLFQPRCRPLPGKSLDPSSATAYLQSRRRQLHSAWGAASVPTQRHPTSDWGGRFLESHRTKRNRNGDLDSRRFRVALCWIPETRSARYMCESVTVVNGFATVVLAVVIDPQVSVMTDDVIEGRISENSFRRAITTLAGARVLGTLCAQAALVPAALVIVRIAELI